MKCVVIPWPRRANARASDAHHTTVITIILHTHIFSPEKIFHRSSLLHRQLTLRVGYNNRKNNELLRRRRRWRRLTLSTPCEPHCLLYIIYALLSLSLTLFPSDYRIPIVLCTKVFIYFSFLHIYMHNPFFHIYTYYSYAYI